MANAKRMIKQINITEEIKKVCTDLANFLIEKNRKYGNSALEPIRIFSKCDSIEQLKVRMDDKLSRLISGQKDDNEDPIKDLVGYWVLLQIAEKESRKWNIRWCRWIYTFLHKGKK